MTNHPTDQSEARAREVLAEHAERYGYPLAAASIRKNDDPWFYTVCARAMLAFAARPLGEVERLRGLEALTTRGEWIVAEGSLEDGSIYIDADDTGDRPVAMIMSGSPHNQDRHDAAFIVAAVAFARAALQEPTR